MAARLSPRSVHLSRRTAAYRGLPETCPLPNLDSYRACRISIWGVDALDTAGKTAFVTGGASGLGLAMAKSFASAGMNVVLADVEQASLDSATAWFESANTDVLPVRLDVTERAGVSEAVDAAEARFGPIHVLCNNAGVAVGGATQDMQYNDWDWVLGVNLNGVVNTLQTVLPRMLAHGEPGHIVNTASMAGHFGIKGMSVYNASKFAVVGLSESLRADLEETAINVSVLCPGVVKTGIFDSGRNRPTTLMTSVDTAAQTLTSDASAQDRPELITEMLESGLEPETVGDMVLDAVRDNDFYIFSHPEYAPVLELRGAEQAQSFERWQRWRHEHGIADVVLGPTDTNQ